MHTSEPRGQLVQTIGRYYLLFKRLLVSLNFFILASCTTPYGSAIFQPENGVVTGIQQILDAERESGLKTAQAHVLMIHGMCYHDPSWVEQANANMASVLNLSVVPENEPPIPIGTVVGGDIQPGVYVRHLISADVDVTTFSVLWSPISAAHTRQLCYDTTAVTSLCTQAGNSQTRAKLNALLKNEIIDSCLSDAVFYAGQTGKTAIRSAIKKAVLLSLSNQKDRTAGSVSVADLDDAAPPLFIVSESLGSKMLFDSISELRKDASDGSKLEVALSRTQQIYMMANQIPILSLADEPAGSNVDVNSSGGINSQERLYSSLNEVARIYQAGAAARSGFNKKFGVTAPSRLRIAAFSDPNDILSFHLTGAGLDTSAVEAVDITISVAPTYFGLAENPEAAHLNYLATKAVKSVVRCGKPIENSAHCEKHSD